MRAYLYKEFNTLPIGTVFLKWGQFYFISGPYVLEEKCGDELYYARDLYTVDMGSDSNEWSRRMFDMIDNKASYPLNVGMEIENNNTNQRAHDERSIKSGPTHDLLFLVYERDDLLELQKIIDTALKVGGK